MINLGNHASNKLKVVQVVGVDVGEVVDGVSDPIAGAALEERIVGVEDLAADDDVPLAQQSARVLALLAFNKVKVEVPRR